MTNEIHWTKCVEVIKDGVAQCHFSTEKFTGLIIAWIRKMFCYLYLFI